MTDKSGREAGLRRKPQPGPGERSSRPFGGIATAIACDRRSPEKHYREKWPRSIGPWSKIERAAGTVAERDSHELFKTNNRTDF